MTNLLICMYRQQRNAYNETHTHTHVHKRANSQKIASCPEYRMHKHTETERAKEMISQNTKYGTEKKEFMPILKRFM